MGIAIQLGLLTSLAFVIAWLVAAWVIGQAARLGLVQEPNHRSSHDRPTPGGGGLGIVLAGLIAGTIVMAMSPDGGLGLVLIAGVPLAVAGLLDDIRPLSAGLRLLIQFLAVLALFGPVFAHDLSATGLIALLAMMLAGLWWINLFNFMDGIDGLAAGQAVFMLLGGAGLAAIAEAALPDSPAWRLLPPLAGACLGFLLLNRPPARVFMGDVGSLWLAFMILALASVGIRDSGVQPAAWIVLAAVFVTDASVTLLTRMLRGERWTQAHRSHAYQRLARRWQGADKRGHRRVTRAVLIIDTAWLLPLAVACQTWPAWRGLWLALAYAPLLLVAIRVGAGRDSNAA
ncbi:MAG: glycosyltransferase family 4 protein [Burkholderiaceae bacterium]